jgi:hypothetical protein
MLRKLLLPSIAGLAVSMLTLPLQAAPASNATSLRATAGESSSVEQVHYYRRHHRYSRYYYRSPGVYFYTGHHHHHRHHRYWRHW